MLLSTKNLMQSAEGAARAPDSLGRIEQGFSNVLARQARVLAQNLLHSHPVCHHCNDRGHRKPQALDAREAAHHIRVRGYPIERHTAMLRAKIGTRR